MTTVPLRLNTPTCSTFDKHVVRRAAFESRESQRSRKSRESRSGLTLVAFLRPADVSCSVSALLRGIFIHAAAHATILACVHPRRREKRVASRQADNERVEVIRQAWQGRTRQGEANRIKPRCRHSTDGMPHQMHNCRRRSRYVGSFDDENRRDHVTRG